MPQQPEVSRSRSLFALDTTKRMEELKSSNETAKRSFSSPKNSPKKGFPRFLRGSSALKATKSIFDTSDQTIKTVDESVLTQSREQETGPSRVATPAHGMSERNGKNNSKVTPLSTLHVVLQSRGYSTATYDSLSSAYYNKPTALQKASFHPNLLKLIWDGNREALRDIFKSGISPNPCSESGESVIHDVCRRGDLKVLQIMMESGARLGVADHLGRNPLHEICRASVRPNFDMVLLITQVDPRLFDMTDFHQKTPLEYVRREHYGLWNRWLDRVKDEIWPIRAYGADQPPPLTAFPPNTKPMKDPANALEPNVAKLVVSGKITPRFARLMNSEDADITSENKNIVDDSVAMGTGDDFTYTGCFLQEDFSFASIKTREGF